LVYSPLRSASSHVSFFLYASYGTPSPDSGSTGPTRCPSSLFAAGNPPGCFGVPVRLNVLTFFPGRCADSPLFFPGLPRNFFLWFITPDALQPPSFASLMFASFFTSLSSSQVLSHKPPFFLSLGLMFLSRYCIPSAVAVLSGGFLPLFDGKRWPQSLSGGGFFSLMFCLGETRGVGISLLFFLIEEESQFFFSFLVCFLWRSPVVVFFRERYF